MTKKQMAARITEVVKAQARKGYRRSQIVRTVLTALYEAEGRRINARLAPIAAKALGKSYNVRYAKALDEDGEHELQVWGNDIPFTERVYVFLAPLHCTHLEAQTAEAGNRHALELSPKAADEESDWLANGGAERLAEAFYAYQRARDNAKALLPWWGYSLAEACEVTRGVY